MRTRKNYCAGKQMACTKGFASKVPLQNQPLFADKDDAIVIPLHPPPTTFVPTGQATDIVLTDDVG